LLTSNNTLGNDDPFRVRTGYIHSNGVSFRRANVSAVSGPLTATLTSDNIAIGELVTTSTTSATATVQVPVNNDLSSSTVATGGVALRPTGIGIVNVSASASGYSNYAGSSVAVTMSLPTMSMADVWFGDKRLGGGLQAPYRVTLGASQHGGVTVRVASGDTFRILLAPDATTAGTSFIDLFIADGSTSANFYVQGINGVTGDVTLTATTPLFPTSTLDVELVQGVIDIHSLITTTTAGAVDDPFRVRTGYIHSNGVTFRYAPVSAGDAPLLVLLTSSDTAVGEVKTLVEIGASATIEIDSNQFDSPSTVASGGIAFDPIATGSTSISAEVIGFDNSWSGSVETITVNP
jgi:hypothetical protein